MPDDTDKLFNHGGMISRHGAFRKRQLIAVIETAMERWNNRLRVTELWIVDAHRRQGIGTAHMDIAMKGAKEGNWLALMQKTQSRNENAIAFYLDACAYGNSGLTRKEVCLEMGILHAYGAYVCIIKFLGGEYLTALNLGRNIQQGKSFGKDEMRSIR